MRVVVTGKSGQVVTALRSRESDAVILPIGRPELDLAHPQNVVSLLRTLRADAIVSAAAYTAVDKAESELNEATAINARAPGHLAAAAQELGIPIVHISTDYVFDGLKSTPYVETDPTGPLGAYGLTKLAGEGAVAAATDNHAIVRTAWVYSPYGNNFLKTMLRLAGERPELRVVSDQIGNPTSAFDIADAILQVVRNLLSAPQDASLRGTFHMAGQGQVSWAGFAQEIMMSSAALGGPHVNVVPISTAEYPTPVRRPANSCLDSTKLSEMHNVVLPKWQTSTRAVVAHLIEGKA